MARITNAQVESKIASLGEFQSNSAAGFAQDVSMSGSGRLPSEWLARLEADHKSDNGIMYMVYSYRTPIAWVLGDGSVTVPAVKYSVTTSRTQSAVRRAFSMAHDQEHKPAE